MSFRKLRDVERFRVACCNTRCATSRGITSPDLAKVEYEYENRFAEHEYDKGALTRNFGPEQSVGHGAADNAFSNG